MNLSTQRYVFLLVASPVLFAQFASADDSCSKTTKVTLPGIGNIGSCLAERFDPTDSIVSFSQSPIGKLLNIDFDDITPLTWQMTTGSIDLTYLSCKSNMTENSDNVNIALLYVAKLVSCLDLAATLNPIGLVNLSADLSAILYDTVRKLV